MQNPKRNSTAMPYMWAMGNMLSMLSPAFTCLLSRLMTNSMLLHSERYGSMTPFENPVVPLV